MRNLRLEIEYEGTNYCGWQVQKSPQPTVPACPAGRHSQQKKSIQGIIEKTLKKILREKVKLIASGRTDSGVHAFAQVANFKTNSRIATDKLQKALNALLPCDIVVSKIEKVGLDFHSRFDVKSKVYRYKILNRAYPCVFIRNTAYFYSFPLDIKLMRQEARCLLGRHDFKSFCASGSSAKNTVRNIKCLSIKRLPYNLLPATCCLKESHLILIDIEADGFLYNMVRNIAGTLIEAGRGRFRKGQIKKALFAKDRRLSGPTAPARGLSLVRVNY